MLVIAILWDEPWDGRKDDMTKPKRKTRSIHRINPANVMKLAAGKMHCDGGGLWLRKTGKTSGSWAFRYQIDKVAHELGLGGINTVNIEEARDEALRLRKLHKAKERIDPLAQKRADAAKKEIKAVATTTFRERAEEFIKTQSPGWSSAKHAAQWTQSLKAYAFPLIGDLPIGDIDEEAIKAVLRQPVDGTIFWYARPETASRVLSRIKCILDASKRASDNPARWDNLKNDFVSRKKAEKGQERHHPAMPYAEVPAFLKALRERESVAARCLEFTILCACRIGESRLATFGEIDFDSRTWTIPATRVKTREAHQAPLAPRAIEILQALRREGGKDDELIFPGRGGVAVSDKSVRECVPAGYTTHGFRSTFDIWASERGYPADVIDTALTHKIGSKVQRAYRRTTFLDKRRELADTWCRFCSGETAVILPMKIAHVG